VCRTQEPKSPKIMNQSLCSTQPHPKPQGMESRKRRTNHHNPSTPKDTRTEPASQPHHTVRLLRKEVIQPHLPVRLPCYDFVPIASPTFDNSLPRRG
jgi:hypothetical protein